MRMEGKVVIVTAATRGIGYAIVKKMAEEGATVYMGARNMEAAKEKADVLNATVPGVVKPVYNDASVWETYDSMVQTVVDAEGHVDVLVNNFGGSDPRTDLDIENTKFDDYIATVNSNLGSVFRCAQLVIPSMKSNGGGSIVNIGSVGGIVPDISQIGYGSSKAAINYLTKLIAVQEARNNIRCNAVLPGMTATDAVKSALTDNFKEFFLKHTPIRRMGEPEEIANAVVYFASDESRFTTGQIMDVSGGFGLATPVYGDMIMMQQKR